MKVVEATSPAGLSSFFAICDKDREGNLIRDPLRIGAIGGGFKLSPRIKTRVVVEETTNHEVTIYINGKAVSNAITSRNVIRELLRRSKVDNPLRIKVEHYIPQPIGSGFGTSGAGAITLAIAFSRALKLKLTTMELAQIAHKAEVEAKTGLGTVGALVTAGSCIVTRKPGAIGYGLVDSIPLDSSKYKIIVIYYGPMLTRDILTDPTVRDRVNKAGWETLSKLLKEPSPENLLRYSYEFAVKSGFITENLKRAIKVIEELNLEIIGYAQNMLGNALHLLVDRSEADDVKMKLQERLEHGKVLVYDLDDSTVILKEE